MAEQQRQVRPFQVLPEGTVTFLFTDIEGSTRLLQRLGEGYAALLASHHRLLRQTFDQWGGQEMGTEGDAFFVAFPKATQAVAAAAEAQRALAGQEWPEGVTVRVRMGAHTGEPWVAEEGYVGIDLHRAARIAHVGHGGQVLLSETTTALVQDDLPDGVTLLDLGRHLLKDMHRPEHIRQLVIEGLESSFPPLTSQTFLPAESERPAREVGECPYRGLAAFREADAPFYFGRESFIDTLEEAVHRRPMVAVIVGSSGSGKSSALFAGLLPRLRKEPGWTVAALRPGGQPFFALAGALIPLLEGKLSETDRLLETQKLAEGLSQGNLNLVQIIERILDKDQATRKLLLLLDQFEELYTLGPDESLQQRFIDQLLEVVAAGQGRQKSPGVVLMTMRADFMGQALAYRPLADALQEASLLMGPMNREELRAAVEKPAGKQGAAFEAGLVERVLDDVGDKPGNLPLLEFTLTQLWEVQDDGWLSHDDYEALGGVEGALASYADQVYDGLSPAEQEGARRALVQLVRPGEGTEDTRRVATRQELGDEGWALLQHLADQRLVVTGRDAEGRETAEVIHEALIQRWGRFRAWMEGDRAFRAWQERLRANLREWKENDQDDGALLSGAPLSAAQGWLAGRGEELSPAERKYIQASVARQEQREQARLEQKHKEQQLLAEQRAARRLRRLAAALVIFILIAAVAALFAVNNARRAEEAQATAEAESEVRATAQAEAEIARDQAGEEAEAARRAEVAASAAEAAALGEADRAQSAEEAARAAEAETARQGRIVLAQSLASLGPTVLQETNDTELAALLALEAANINQELGGEINWIVDLTLRRLLGAPYFNVILAGHPGPVRSAVFSPDGRTLASGSASSEGPGSTARVEAAIYLWDLANPGAEPAILEGHSNLITAIAYSPDGQILASGSADRTVRLWNLEDHDASPAVLSGHTAGVNALAFSPDGIFLASGGDDRVIRLWDATGSENSPLLLAGQDSPVKSLAFSPDGSVLASGGVDGDILFWDLAQPGEFFTILEGHQSSALSLAFSPDGGTLVSGGADGLVLLWDVADPSGPTTFFSSDDLVWSVAFSPDGKTLAVAGADRAIRLWDLADSSADPDVLQGHEDTIYTLAFSSDGQSLASGSADRAVRLWRLDDPESRPDVLKMSQEGITFGVFSPDGRSLALASWDGIIRILDMADPHAPPTLLQGYTEFIFGLAFSPDGQNLANGGASLLLWNLSDLSAPPQTLATHPASIRSVAFAPSGQTLAYSDLNVHLLDLVDFSSPPISLGPESILEVTVGVGFSHDGRLLASTRHNSASSQGYVEIWDLGHLDREPAILSHGDELVTSGSFINTSAFAPDDKTLVTGGNDRTLRFWDLANLDEPPVIIQGGAEIWQVAISPGGDTLAAAGTDGAVRLWSMADPTAPPAILQGHQGPVRFIAFSPDRPILASGGEDGTLRLWPTLDLLRELGCQQVRRNLTQEEWALYLGEDEPYRETCPELD